MGNDVPADGSYDCIYFAVRTLALLLMFGELPPMDANTEFIVGCNDFTTLYKFFLLLSPYHTSYGDLLSYMAVSSCCSSSVLSGNFSGAYQPSTSVILIRGSVGSFMSYYS